MKKIIFSATLFLVSFSIADAQVAANQKISLTLENAIDIAVSSSKGTSFTFANTGDYEKGLINKEASTFQVKSNRPWTVTVNAEQDNFSALDVKTEMPSSVLGFRITRKGAFEELSTKPVFLTNGERGVNEFVIDYTANPGFDYDAGNYVLSVIYTATQQ